MVTLILKTLLKILKTNDFRGDPSDISAKKTSLVLISVSHAGSNILEPEEVKPSVAVEQHASVQAESTSGELS